MENINKAYYAIIPANVRYDEDLTPNAKLLYGEITALCNEKGYCWASNTYFAELYKTSTKTISRCISQLVDKNYISLELVYKENSKEIQERRLRLYFGGGMDKNVHRYRQKCQDPMDKNVHTPMDKNVQDNNTIINNTFNNKDYIYSRVIEYLNKKAGTKYKDTTKKTRQLIKSRIDEGFTEEDFLRVIDNKVSEWKGTEWENYLRPETLFGTKFENYLNQKKVVRGNSNGSFGKDPSEGKGKWAGFTPPDTTGIDWENEWEKYRDNQDPDLI